MNTPVFALPAGKTVVILLVSLVLTSGCTKKEQPTDLVTFPLRGEVVEIDTTRSRVIVAHEEIPDYMMAMTMPFKVKNPALLRNLQPGDSITATLAVSRTESWVVTITVIGKGDAPDPQLVAGAIMARMFKPGDVLPRITFLNEEGKKTGVNDFRGKAVALTFIYTRCPLPDFCIRMSDHFAKLQKLLSQDASLSGKWHLLTISFDPKFDTPDVLQRYARTYDANLATWDFLTDQDTSGSNIMKLADGLGLTYENDEGGLIAHNLRTVLVDKEGKIARVLQGNEWTPEEVFAEMKGLM